MAIWRMRIVCWLPKATNTYSEYYRLLLLQGNNGFTNAPQCYVTCALSVLLAFTSQLPYS